MPMCGLGLHFRVARDRDIKPFRAGAETCSRLLLTCASADGETQSEHLGLGAAPSQGRSGVSQTRLFGMAIKAVSAAKARRARSAANVRSIPVVIHSAKLTHHQHR